MNQAHGRHETRELYAFEVTPQQTGFAHTAMAAVRICTTHHLKEVRASQDIEILLSSRSSQAMSSAQMEEFRRNHWGIEARHYVRDVSFGEDRSNACKGHTPQNMATLRNLIIGMCAIDTAKKQQHSSSLSVFRTGADNDRDWCTRLVRRPLLDGT